VLLYPTVTARRVSANICTVQLEGGFYFHAISADHRRESLDIFGRKRPKFAIESNREQTAAARTAEFEYLELS